MRKRCDNRIFIRNKNGEILVENVIFIVLNILFISILAIFVVKQSSGVAVIEQTSAKNIALIIDAAKPVSVISLDMSKQKSIAEKNGIAFEDIVKISGNVVAVKLSSKTGYEYSFFNDVDVSKPYPDINTETGEYTGNYIFIVNLKGVSNE
jgi:hypothetical protein